MSQGCCMPRLWMIYPTGKGLAIQIIQQYCFKGICCLVRAIWIYIMPCISIVLRPVLATDYEKVGDRSHGKSVYWSAYPSAVLTMPIPPTHTYDRWDKHPWSRRNWRAVAGSRSPYLRSSSSMENVFSLSKATKPAKSIGLSGSTIMGKLNFEITEPVLQKTATRLWVPQSLNPL